MTRQVRLGAIAAIPPGEGRNVRVGGIDLAVFHGRDGRAYVTQAECPHRKGPLADGLFGGTTLVCPLHEWSFDLHSGMALNGACGIRVYPCRVEDDGVVVVEIDEAGEPPVFRVSDYRRFGQ
jgi:nitrite reductase (NADH) small subunit